MPNYCYNSFELTGPTDKIKALWAAATTTDNDSLLQAMVPMPEELENTTAPSESGLDWYSWRVNNWGTKWDIDPADLELVEEGDTSYITGSFTSAWSPPTTAYDTFLSENEDCTITSSYDEEGMSYVGIYDNGHDECYGYDLSDLSDIPDHIIEEFALDERREQWLEWNEEEE